MKKLTIAILATFMIGLLAPTAEAKAPIISNIRLTSPTDQNVTITFQTDTVSTSKIIYGTNTKYTGGWVSSSRGPQTDHSLTLSSLLPNTTYHFQVQATNTIGQTEYANDQTFTTQKFVDKTPPAISDIVVVFVTGRTISLSWKTNEVTSGYVDIGTDMNFGIHYGYGSTDGRFFDTTLYNLATNTQYYLRIYAQDATGNNTYSRTLNIRTAETDSSDKSELVITNIRPISNSDEQIGTNQVLVTWHTGKAANGIVYVGPTANSYTISATENPPRTTEHEILVTGLTPSTEYHFKATSTDVVGKTASSADLVFTTNAVVTETSKTPIINNPKNPKLSVGFYKAPSDPRVYMVTKGFKHYISNMDILRSYGAAGADIKTMDKASLDKLPVARLLKSEDSPTVYYLYPNNKKKAIRSAAIFDSYPNNSWENIITATNLDLQSYTDIRVVKMADDPLVYLLTDNIRQSFVDEQAFTSRGYKWSDIGLVNRHDIDSYEVKESLQ